MWLFAYSAQSNCLKKCWVTAVWKHFMEIIYRWVSIFIKHNALRNFCKMWTILSRPYCVYKLQLVASTISLFTSLMTTKWIYNVYWFYRGCPYAYMYIVSCFSNNFPVGFIFNHEHSPVSAIWTATSFFESHSTRSNTTRQIWGIWKLRPAYSPETPNLGQNRWCFVPCDLEIWWMTLENNRAHLLCCFKLCATFHSHRWIQTGVAVRKRPIWVKFDDF